MIDDELRALVSVDPSPDFEARTRIHVRLNASSVRWRRGAPVMLALAASLGVAIGVAVLSRSDRHADAPRALTASAPDPAPAFAAPPTVVIPPALEAPAGVPGTRRPPRLAAADGRPAAAELIVGVTRSQVSLPQVQIDDAESVALRSLFASPAAGAVVDVAPASTTELVIPEIAIEPLTLTIRAEGASQ